MATALKISGDKRVHQVSLIKKANEMIPYLKQHANETENNRRMLEETHERFLDAGFYSALQPARYGGLELDFGAHTLFSRELGKGCASSAWVAAILACHGWMGGMMPDECQAEIWEHDPQTCVATSFLAAGTKVERRGEEFLISGRWRFSSGVDFCKWALLILPVPQPEGKGPPDVYFVMVDLADCLVEDTWQSNGLKGSGSNDIVVDNVLIPKHRMLDARLTKGCGTPGSEAAGGGYLYGLPLFAISPFNLIGPAMGAARGALEDMIADMKSRQSVTGADLTKVSTVHERIARAAALLDAADAVIERQLEGIVSKGRAGEEYSIEERVRYRINLGHSAKMCCDAVDTLLPLSGGRGLETTHPMQRAWRDVHAIAQHFGLVWDIQSSFFGSVALGHGCPDPKI